MKGDGKYFSAGLTHRQWNLSDVEERCIEEAQTAMIGAG